MKVSKTNFSIHQSDPYRCKLIKLLVYSNRDGYGIGFFFFFLNRKIISLIQTRIVLIKHIIKITKNDKG